MGTFNSIFSEVKERLGGRTNIDTRITSWINDAYFDILMTPQYMFFELDQTGTINTVDGTREYNLVSEFPSLWFIQMVRDDTNEREIHKKSIKTFDRMAHTEGQPTRYARFGNNLVLDPTPDGAYDILVRYRTRPNELSSGSSTILGREWDEPIILLSVIKGYTGLEQPEKAGSHQALYDVRMAKMEEIIKLEDDDNEPTIGPYLEDTL